MRTGDRRFERRPGEWPGGTGTARSPRWGWGLGRRTPPGTDPTRRPSPVYRRRTMRRSSGVRGPPRAPVRRWNASSSSGRPDRRHTLSTTAHRQEVRCVDREPGGGRRLRIAAFREVTRLWPPAVIVLLMRVTMSPRALAGKSPETPHRSRYSIAISQACQAGQIRRRPGQKCPPLTARSTTDPAPAPDELLHPRWLDQTCVRPTPPRTMGTRLPSRASRSSAHPHRPGASKCGVPPDQHPDARSGP